MQHAFLSEALILSLISTIALAIVAYRELGWEGAIAALSIAHVLVSSNG